MADSKVAVFNLALSFLGGHQNTSVDASWEKSTIGELCNTNFPTVLRECLEAHNWSFATQSQGLARLPNEGRDGYQYRYQLPPDCLRPIRLEGYGQFDCPYFIIEGEQLLTSISPANLIYIVFIDEPKRWPPAFTTALAWGLAVVLATAKNNDQDKQQQCLQNSRIYLEEAWARDLQTQNPRLRPSGWKMARLGRISERRG